MSRRRLLVGIVVISLGIAGIAYVGAGVVDPPQESPTEKNPPGERALIQPVDNGTQLWPYTSRNHSTVQRTLAINLVLKGEPDEVRTALTDRTELDFRELPESEEDAESDTYQVEISESDLEWDDAHGSIRYTYMRSSEGGEWMDESYQLYEGEYLGERHHIRAYEDPDEEYTAIQIHREYFDFFHLRHQVVDARQSATMLEREFIDEPFVEDVTREYHGLRGGRSDGWMSTVRLGTLLPLDDAGGYPSPWLYDLLAILAVGSIGAASTRGAVRSLGTNLADWSRQNWAGFALVAGLIVLVTGVRTTGIALERLFTDISPQLFAGAVYPILALGPPVLVLVLAKRLDPLPAFGFAVIGLGTAFTLDTVWVGIGVVPVPFVLHRVGLMLALGVLALGIARELREESETIDYERALLIAAGSLAWFAGLVMPLFGMV